MKRWPRGVCLFLLLALAAPVAAAQRGAPAVGDDVVAEVDDVAITRGELTQARRMLAAEQHMQLPMLAAELQLPILGVEQPKPLPTNAALVDQLIDRALWERYLAEERLHPSGPEIRRAIMRLDAELREKGSSYKRFLDSRGLPAEAHATFLRHKLASERLAERVRNGLADHKVRVEFDAHPLWYDGSRIRISEIFISTEHVANDPAKLKQAKERVDRIHAWLVAGKDFAPMARDFSYGPSAQNGGDIGWLVPKGEAGLVDSLIAVAWKLKVGQLTEPIRGPGGWHILKVTAREGAHFTYLGCRERIRSELTRRRLEAILKVLKAKARIKKFL